MENIIQKFEEMGAVAKIGTTLGMRAVSTGVKVDVVNDVFFLDIADNASLKCLSLAKRDRHLLLLARDGSGKETYRYLCGYDERHWFVAAVPDRVSTVKQARESLKPQAVREAQKIVPKKDRNRRKNKAYLRQGEWFFMPVNLTRIAKRTFGGNAPITVLKNEPIQRGAGNPHIVEELARIGGSIIYVHEKYPDGVSKTDYDSIVQRAREDKNWALLRGWREGRVGARAFGRGKVTHPDHATVCLPGWHEILPNTEEKAEIFRSMSFID